ncbi:hypothetical protein ACSMEV_13945 [Pseudomonas sp. MLB6B]
MLEIEPPRQVWCGGTASHGLCFGEIVTVHRRFENLGTLPRRVKSLTQPFGLLDRYSNVINGHIVVLNPENSQGSSSSGVCR